MGLDRAPIEFQTFYFSHVLVVPPIVFIGNMDCLFYIVFAAINTIFCIGDEEHDHDMVDDDIFCLCDSNFVHHHHHHHHHHRHHHP